MVHQRRASTAVGSDAFEAVAAFRNEPALDLLGKNFLAQGNWLHAGFSKFLSGVAGARASPRVVLACGLAATAAVNIAFGFGAGYTWFLMCWGANGLLQGMGRQPVPGGDLTPSTNTRLRDHT